ncbi:YecA family protein [Pseudomarimonas salicorniae]|uniref:YecA family protein n=1 Tax=Pseudomarimonas salicorniae TaxID=2933270 RepID=A0ABT0GH21_9GAMM|nr:YecA family protein [Lysobacter sp. CAU 1642]MCK7593367.1 YecA family protein [Lysobacter sp. CAU 1642]
MTEAFNPAEQREPLGEADVQRLKQLLDTFAVSGDGMSLEMLDGLFSALIAGPATVDPERFLPLVLGHGHWPEEARAQTLALAGRLWNHIEARIEIDPDGEDSGFMPFFSVPAGLPEDPGEYAEALAKSGYPLGAGWAGGFLYAVQLDLPRWRALEEKVPEINAGVDLLIRMIQLEDDDKGEAPSAEQRVAMAAAMPYFLRALRQQDGAA